MTLLDRHLLRALVRGGTPVFLLFLGLFGFVALAEQLEDVGKGAFGTLDAVRVTGFELPRIALDLLPVTCLLGTVIGLGMLGNNAELTAMQAGGLSVLRLTRPLLLLLLTILAAALAAQQTIIPLFASEAAQLRSQSSTTAAPSGDDAFWTRSRSSLIRIGGVSYGTMPQNIEIYALDQDGRVAQLTQAATADVLAPGEWLLRNVRTTNFGTQGVERSTHTTLRWRSDIDPEQVTALLRADHALAPADLVRYIAHLDRNGLDAHRYRVLLWQQIGLAASLFGMGLLAIPFVFGAMRTTPLGSRVTLCALIGLCFHLTEQASLQMGLLHRLPPPVTGLAPDLLLLTTTLLLLRARR